MSRRLELKSTLNERLFLQKARIWFDSSKLKRKSKFTLNETFEGKQLISQSIWEKNISKLLIDEESEK